MTEIIPTILVKTFEEVKEKVKQVEELVDWVQLDIMDGVFVDNETFNEPKKLKRFKTKAKLEAHLMVQKPEEVIDNWLEVVDRVIIHFESKITNRELGIKEMIKKVHKKGKQIGLALNPETHPVVTLPFLKDLDLVLFMTVQPGWGGQKFKDWVLTKIEFLREKWPDGNIEVDGGVNDENIKTIVKAGANLICAGSYIFRSQNVKEAIDRLNKNK